MVLVAVAGVFSPSHAQAAEGRPKAKVVRVGNEVTISQALAPKQRARKRTKKKIAVVVVKRPRARARARPHRRVATVQADSPAALRSNAVLILDPTTREVLFEKHPSAVMPIASLTKLMTALVVVEAKQDMAEMVAVTDADVDRLKHSRSRLRVAARLTRAEMLHIALMSSENRAANALGRHYPGGAAAFVRAMNAKAAALGMSRTRFVEPTGLSADNVSTAEDLAKLVVAAQRQPVIREYSTDPDHMIDQGGRATAYRNSNGLISNGGWDIDLQKTGYTSEAGRCMVLHATVQGREVVMVFLDAQGKFSRAADANRIRSWMAGGHRTAQRHGIE